MVLQYEGDYFGENEDFYMETEGWKLRKGMKKFRGKRMKKVPRRRIRRVPKLIKRVRRVPIRERVIYKIPVSTKKQLAALKSHITKRDRIIKELRGVTKKKDQMIRDYNTQISKLKSVVDKNSLTLKELESILDEQEGFLDEQDEIIYELESRLGMAESLEKTPQIMGIEEEDYEEEYPEALDEIDKIQQGNVFEFSHK